MSRPQSFANSFWTPDYLSGIASLFEILDSGISQNQLVLTHIATRIKVETTYGNALDSSHDAGAIASLPDSSLAHAFSALVTEARQQGREHARIAAHLERFVRGKFSQWATAHKQRVSAAKDILTKEVKGYQRAVQSTEKAQQTYFLKARQLEDFADKGVPKIVTSPPQPGSPTKRMSWVGPGKQVDLSAASPEVPAKKEKEVKIGMVVYTKDEFVELLNTMTTEIQQETFKVALLGTYERVIEGEQLVNYARKYLELKSLGDAERFGQWMVDNGYLRLVGAVGSKFSGSTGSRYQWQDLAFNPERAFEKPETPEVKPFRRSHTKTFSLVSGYLSGLMPEETQKNRESQMSKLQREIAEADQKYQDMVLDLELQRTQLEQKLYETFEYMQQCERDRLAAVKTVLHDFAESVGNSVEVLVKSTENMKSLESIIDIQRDLQESISRHKTGEYLPRLVVYDNFFKRSEKIQTFGVELSFSKHFVLSMYEYLTSPAALHQDQVDDNASSKSVSSDVTAEFPNGGTPGTMLATAVALSMKGKYRKLSDESKQLLLALWTSPPSSILEVQPLRQILNTGLPVENFKEVVEGYPITVVLSVLKEYFVELPDSIVPSTVYDILKPLYPSVSKKDNEKAPKQRGPEETVDKIVSLLGHLPKDNLDILNLIVTHFAELCGLPEESDLSPAELSSSNSGLSQLDMLTNAVARYVIRPRVQTSLNITDTHPALFLKDLITHRHTIFQKIWQRQEAAIEARSRSSSEVARRQTASNERDREFRREVRKSAGGMRPLALASSKSGMASPSISASTGHHGSGSGSLGSANGISSSEDGLLSPPPPISNVKHKRSFSNSKTMMNIFQPQVQQSKSAGVSSDEENYVDAAESNSVPEPESKKELPVSSPAVDKTDIEVEA